MVVFVMRIICYIEPYLEFNSILSTLIYYICRKGEAAFRSGHRGCLVFTLNICLAL